MVALHRVAAPLALLGLVVTSSPSLAQPDLAVRQSLSWIPVGGFGGVNISTSFGASWSGRTHVTEPTGFSERFDLSGYIAGIGIEYAYQTGPVVFGVGFSAGWGQIKGGAGVGGFHSTVSNVTGIDLRLGYEWAPQHLFYVKGGPTWSRLNLELQGVGSQTETVSGFRYGLGWQYKFADSFSVFVEGMHQYLGDLNGTAAVFGGTPRGRFEVHTVNVGGSYHFASDVRVKRDVVTIGHLPSGIAIYRFRYLDDDQVYVGVMAQNVQDIVPDAISAAYDGTLYVDYRQIGMAMLTWEDWVESPMAQSLANAWTAERL